MHQGQPFLFDLFDHDTEDGRMLFLVFRKEDQSGSVLTFFRYGDALQ